ncbi:MAG: MFS transporter [Novosphingobium sp.]|nr:MFS transporter [Novosphingobium sp.]
MTQALHTGFALPQAVPAAGGHNKTGVLAAATTGNALATTASVHAVFGTFLVPLSESFGWNRASISVVLAILAAASAVIYPLAGRYADVHGTRRMVLTGNVLFALSVAALALTGGSLLQFYVTFLAIGIFGALPSTSIFSKLVAEWFRDNRGSALGVSAGLGNGIGSVLMPIAAALLISAGGWRVGYLGIAGLILFIGFPVFFFLLRDAPGCGEHAGAKESHSAIEGMSLRDAARLPAFWLIMVAIASGGGISTAVLSHVVPIVGERGFSLATGTAVVSVFALVGSFWQIATGRLLDVARGPRIVAPMYGLAIAGLLLLEFGTSPLPLVAGGVCMGIALGSQFGSLPFFIARYFGLRNFGTILGVMYSAVIAAQGITPVLLDASFDLLGSYRAAVLVGVGIMACGSLLLLLLPAYRTQSGLSAATAIAH